MSRGALLRPSASGELKRNPPTRKGPKRKIVPLNGPSSDGARAPVTNLDDDDEPLEYAREYAETSSMDGSDATSRVRRSATQRARDDATHIAFVAPRIAIGAVNDFAERASRGVGGFADVFDFVQTLGSSDDVLRDVVERTEREIDRLESIGVRTSTPVRSVIKDMIPSEVYDKYLTPAVEYAEGMDDASMGGGNGASSSASGVVMDDAVAFDEAAVNAAADAVAAAMRGVDLDAGAETMSSETKSTASMSTKPRAPDNAEDNFENMAAEAIMSASTMAASYAAPAQDPYAATPPPVATSAEALVEETSAPAVEESAPSSPPTSPMTSPFDSTVGYWRKIPAKCPDEDDLMDLMDMNIVFRQAAGLLNYLTIDRPSPESWRVATNAGIIQISEVYPINGSRASASRRDLRPGEQSGAVVVDASASAVALSIAWSAPLAGTQNETFRVNTDDDTLVRTVRITLDDGSTWNGEYVYARA
jgi:hypothetical protein